MDSTISATGPAIEDNQIQMPTWFTESGDETSRAPDLDQESVELSDESHDKLLNYLLARLSASASKRLRRISRYARIDQSVVTWMMMSPEDTKRDIKEDNTGRSQALPMTIPLIQSHVDDTVAFFAEIFAPIGGNFYSMPGKPDKTGAIQALTDEMNQDTLINNYYAHVTQAMRQLCKYNIGGFDVYWSDGDKDGVGQERLSGNVCEAIDMYNYDYDPSVDDVEKIRTDAEWSARFRVRNKLWLLRQASNGQLINIDKVLNHKDSGRGTSTDTYGLGQARYYRNPPAQTKMSVDGNDTPTADEQGGINWAAFNLGLAEDSFVDIPGHEITKMYCWINPNQFGLAEDNIDSLQLWCFLICDAKWIIKAQPIPNAKEIPNYVGRVNKDNMREAMRAIAEYIRPFQRFISFLVNTHVEATRGAIWGVKVYDPTAIDVSSIQNGETSGLLPLNAGASGRDVRTVMQDLRNQLDTQGNVEQVGTFLELVKQFFPNQSLPMQIAGMDRAVTSQVSAVLQGAMRKMHMLARLIDSDIMLPSRQQQYRNIAEFSPGKQNFQGITEDDVAQLLASGLGQINREAAAEQIRSLIFTLLQNPDTMQIIDIAKLFNFWSILMNVGTNLGDFVKAQPTGPVDGQTVDPNAGVQAGAPSPQVSP
jgi:hypothetical protein